MTGAERRSVPAPRRLPPRDLEPSEIETAVRLADVLCWTASERVRPPRECPEFIATLRLALATRCDAFEDIVGALGRATTAVSAEESELYLRQLCTDEPEVFAALSTVLAGAYLMVPDVASFVGYPGQGRRPAPPHQIGDELGGGILDPVVRRGSICRTP